MCKFSVITICRNEEQTIARTLNSVLNQTFTDYEYIIIDGASTDSTLDIINKTVLNRATIISEPDTGIFNAMNKGISKAKGNYIIFINAGDYFINNTALEYAADKLEDYDFVYGDTVFEYPSGFLMRRNSPANLSMRYFFIDSLPHQNSFIKRELFEKIGNFDESFKIVGDYEFSIRAFKAGFSFKYIPKAFAIFNLEGISSDKRFRELDWKERITSLKRHFDSKAIQKLESKRFFLDLIYKKLRYFYFLLRSKMDKKYVLK